MVPKALRKLEQHPGLFDRETLLAARDLYCDFDNLFTAPLHGFKNTEDYWGLRRPNRCCPTYVCLRWRSKRRRTTRSFPRYRCPSPTPWARVSRCGTRRTVAMWAFPVAAGPLRLPGHVRAMPDAVGTWLMAHL